MDHRNAAISQIANRCVHFNGVFINDACRSGVNFHEQFGDGFGCFKDIPCIKPGTDKKCAKAEYPTREAAEKELNEDDEFIDRFLKVSKEAHAHARDAGLGIGCGGRGEMPCPSGCGGTLKYSVAGVNGNLYACCTTKGCHQWME